MRIYVPTTLDGLQALRDRGFAPPVAAHAVTPALREWYTDGDADELEYAAAAEAAEASLRSIAAASATASRRVVVAADVPDSAVRVGGAFRSSITLEVGVERASVVSLHVDDADAEPDVAAAVAAMPAADAGDDDARFTVDAAAGNELLWYDVTELDDVLATH